MSKKGSSAIEALLKDQSDMMKNIQCQLGAVISKSDRLDDKVTHLNDNVMTAFNTRVENVEKNVSETRAIADDAIAQSRANDKAIAEQQKVITSLSKQFDEYVTKNGAWQGKLVERLAVLHDDKGAPASTPTSSKPPSRELNLIFDDIEEGESPTYAQDLLFMREYLKNVLGLSHSRAYRLPIRDAYRRGKQELDRPRPLVVTLDSDADLWFLIKAANRSNVGGNVQRDFTAPVARSRKRLERLKYSLSKGGVSGLTIEPPAALHLNGKVIRVYFPNLTVDGDDTVPEQHFDNDLSDIPLYLREARVKGLEIIKREKADKLAKRGRERQRSGDSRRERVRESSSPGRRDTGSSAHSTTASDSDATDPPTLGGDHGSDTGSEPDAADPDKTITDQSRQDPSSDLDNTMDVADETEQTEADDEQMPPSGTVTQSSSTTNDDSDSESLVASQSILSPESYSRRVHPHAAKFINRSLNDNDQAKHQV